MLGKGVLIMSDSGKFRIATPPMTSLGIVPTAPRTAVDRSTVVDDSLLIREAQQGNTDAFEELVRQYDRAVLRLAVHLTGSQEDAQDIYQEAFLRAYTNLNSFRFECSFYTWIYRIVTNLCLDHLRRRRSRSREFTSTVFPDGEEETILNRLPDHRPGRVRSATSPAASCGS